MDHPCHKCGQSIEDGKAFCAHCGAPQIRVMTPESPAERAVAGGPGLPSAVHEATPVFPGTAIGSEPSRWSRFLRPCALAAGVAALLMSVGLNAFVGALGAGFLAATLAERRSPGSITRAATGATVGGLSGLLLFCLSAFLETLAVVVLHKGADLRSQMMEKVQQAAARYPGPEVQPFIDFVKSPGGFAFMLVASLIFALVMFMVLGGVGGAVSAAFSGKRNKP
jgi:zinc-ribbon domain